MHMHDGKYAYSLARVLLIESFDHINLSAAFKGVRFRSAAEPLVTLRMFALSRQIVEERQFCE